MVRHKLRRGRMHGLGKHNKPGLNSRGKLFAQRVCDVSRANILQHKELPCVLHVLRGKPPPSGAHLCPTALVRLDIRGMLEQGRARFARQDSTKQRQGLVPARRVKLENTEEVA